MKGEKTDSNGTAILHFSSNTLDNSGLWMMGFQDVGLRKSLTSNAP